MGPNVRVSIEVAVMKRLPASGLLVLLLSGAFGAAVLMHSALAQEASVYRWVDAQGIVHFSDQPAADSSAEELPIRYRKSDRGALQARLKAKSELDAAGELREGQEADANAAAEADRQKVLAERDTNCKAARDRVAKYTNALRLYKPGPNGERVYLNNEELDVERADANRAVEQWCN
ncbi:MAG: DUF4124 domain-containing protein [Chromatiales bacterium]|nr:DUF4124 domain-containing protein [Chromatiales bacterium]